MATPEDILAYWLDEIGPKGWYAGGEDLDEEIRDRFEAEWSRTMDGSNALWLTYASGALAYIILVDQFPRNMFRNSGKAFASDAIGRLATKCPFQRQVRNTGAPFACLKERGWGKRARDIGFEWAL